jgi:hypothetical protein
MDSEARERLARIETNTETILTRVADHEVRIRKGETFRSRMLGAMSALSAGNIGVAIKLLSSTTS